MKKFLISFPVLSLLVFLLPLSSALAFGEFNPGGVYNPIHVEVEPTAQYRNQNLEASLKAQHGSSAFYSCMNKVSGCSGDQSDPSRRYSCLLNIQYAFETPLCRAQQPVQCQTGYTLVNGSCVRQQVVPTACPSGYMFIGTGCSPFTCSAGYVPQGNQCAKVQQNTAPAPQTSSQPQPVWNGSIIIEQVAGASGSAGGGSAGGGSAGGSYTPQQDYNQECKNTYGSHSAWDGNVDNAAKTFGCSCDAGYQFNDAQTQCVTAPVVVEPQSQAASLALLTDWQAPAVEESQPEPRRGFWSWLLGLFGL